jgi:hypothetical protein
LNGCTSLTSVSSERLSALLEQRSPFDDIE